MNKNEEIKLLVKDVYPYIKENINDSDLVIRAIVILAKEVEKNTRHKAAELANKLHADIMNI